MSRFANRSKFSPFYALLQLPGVTISEVHINDPEVRIMAKIKAKSGICPQCGKMSKSVHSLYHRTLQDLAMGSNRVNIKLTARKLFCKNTLCSKKIFSQQLTCGLVRYSRRTTRANHQLTQLSLETSARKSSCLSKLIRVQVSPSTCLRLVQKCNLTVRSDIRHIGIDDWAYRKGHTYGTILTDRETGKVIDLIHSRDKADIIDWLRAFPAIETVTRDRAEGYSNAISSTLPDAVQIADRFHLVMNYSDHIIKIAPKLLLDLKQIKLQIPVSPGRENDPVIQKIIDTACGGPKSLDVHKKALIDKAKELHHKGYSKSKIANILALNFRTVQKYVDLKEDQINTGRIPRIDYTGYLDDLILGYCTGEKLAVVFRKIKSKGFKGTQRGLNARFGSIFIQGKQNNRGTTMGIIKKQYLHHRISSREIAIFLTNKNYHKILTSERIESLENYKSKSQLFQELWSLSKEFRSIFEQKSAILLKNWIKRVMQSSFKSLRSFGKGLLKDFEAVKAAITLKGNNGVTEGHVNRLKNIKRQMYGRAGFELLRRKVVLSCTG